MEAVLCFLCLFCQYMLRCTGQCVNSSTTSVHNQSDQKTPPLLSPVNYRNLFYEPDEHGRVLTIDQSDIEQCLSVLPLDHLKLTTTLRDCNHTQMDVCTVRMNITYKSTPWMMLTVCRFVKSICKDWRDCVSCESLKLGSDVPHPAPLTHLCCTRQGPNDSKYPLCEEFCNKQKMILFWLHFNTGWNEESNSTATQVSSPYFIAGNTSETCITGLNRSCHCIHQEVREPGSKEIPCDEIQDKYFMLLTAWVSAGKEARPSNRKQDSISTGCLHCVRLKTQPESPCVLLLAQTVCRCLPSVLLKAQPECLCVFCTQLSVGQVVSPATPPEHFRVLCLVLLGLSILADLLFVLVYSRTFLGKTPVRLPGRNTLAADRFSRTIGTLGLNAHFVLFFVHFFVILCQVDVVSIQGVATLAAVVLITTLVVYVTNIVLLIVAKRVFMALPPVCKCSRSKADPNSSNEHEIMIDTTRV